MLSRLCDVFLTGGSVAPIYNCSTQGHQRNANEQLDGHHHSELSIARFSYNKRS